MSICGNLSRRFAAWSPEEGRRKQTPPHTGDGEGGEPSVGRSLLAPLADPGKVTVLSPAPIRGVLRPCSGGTRFAGALDSAIDRRSADGEQFG